MDEEQEAKYLLRPHACPFCGSSGIRHVSTQEEGARGLLRLCKCNNCHKRWHEIFRMIGVQEAD